MSRVTIEDAGATLERAQKLLSGVPGGLEKATKAAAQRAVQNLRTNAAKAAQERYDISATNLRTEQNVKVYWAYTGGVTASITFCGRRIPLFRFNQHFPNAPTQNKQYSVRAIVNSPDFWKTTYPGMAAKGHVLKSTGATTFDDAFVATMPNGHTGIFERTGAATSNGKDKLRELMGPALPQILGNEEVAQKLSQQTMDKFNERLDHEINRILAGY